MAIFKDMADFRRFIPEIHQSYNWSALSVRIDQATRLKVIPLIGQALHDDLETKHQADTLSAEESNLMERYLLPAIACYTYIDTLTAARVQVSQMGVQEGRSQDGTSGPASFHAIQDVKDEFNDMAAEFMEQALDYLDAEKANFALWSASDQYADRKSLMIWTPSQLAEYTPIGSTLMSYMLVKAGLKRIQIDRIKPNIPGTLYTTLLSEIAADSLSNDNAALLPYIQAYLAPAAIVWQLPYLYLKFDTGGIRIRSAADGPERKDASPSDQIKELKQRLMEQAETAWGNLFSFLELNSASYGFTPQDYTLNDNDTSLRLPDNSCRKSFRV